MTDPLRPFAQLIRALWSKRAQPGEPTQTQTARAGPAPAAPHAGESLRSRLSNRLGAVDPQNVSRMREVFVETTLLWELGEHLARDPAFTEMVARVSDQLTTDATMTQRLHHLLVGLRA